MQALAEDRSGSLPGPPLDKLLGRVTRIRIRRRLTAAAAALVIGLAAAASLQVLHAHLAGTSAATAPQWTDTATGTSPATGAWAAVRYAAQPWGTELEVRVTGMPAGTRCQLRVTNAQDQHIAAGGWTITVSRQHTWYPASVPWPAASLRDFDISAGGQTLVTIPAR